MDNTKTYIKQCDCPEIQEQWRSADLKYPRFEGSYYFNGDDVKIVDYEYPYPKVGDDGFIWLPRQDDLQKMVCDKYRLQIPGFIINDLNCWCESHMLSEYRSMEQLWLAFVMKEKYNKTWDGDKWNET